MEDIPRNLLEEHASAKRKMTAGIVLTAIGAVLSSVGAGLLTWDEIACLVVELIALVFYGVGIPLLVVGIVKRIRANIAINAARDEAKKQAAQSASTYGYDVFGTESAEDADEYLPCEDNTAYDSTPTETAAPTEDID